jgi:hypothetical protein
MHGSLRENPSAVFSLLSQAHKVKSQRLMKDLALADNG